MTCYHSPASRPLHSVQGFLDPLILAFDGVDGNLWLRDGAGALVRLDTAGGGSGVGAFRNSNKWLASRNGYLGVAKTGQLVLEIGLVTTTQDLPGWLVAQVSRRSQTMKLKRVGFFRELPHGFPDGPSLGDSVQSAPRHDETRIVHYLRNSSLFVGCPGIARDALDPARGPSEAPHIFTDGDWAWSGDLAYYVSRYHVQLPEEFVEHMRARCFRPPSDEHIDLVSLEL